VTHMNRFGRATCALALMALSGCSSGGSDAASQQSSLSVSLMDAPVDGVTAVYVKITSMWIKPQGTGPAFELPLATKPLTVNLLELTDKNAAILVDGAAIPAGSYEWLAMDVAAERNVRDSYVMTRTGGEEEVEVDEELRVPSNRVRLVSGFEVPPNQAVKLLFDWDMRKGLVYPPGQGQYMLKPAFRVIDVTAYGVLEGTIAKDTVTGPEPPVKNCLTDHTTDPDVGNVVYVFADAITPDDFGGMGDDPVATVVAKRNTIGDYVYRTLVKPGTYTVLFSCEAGNDDPEGDDDITFLNPIGTTNPIVNQGNTTTVNF
jgi:hypothetical protein